MDDEVTTRNLCQDVAADAGLQVLCAPTTEEALEILDQYPIDIVVTDLQVPQIGGLELLKRIRANNPEIAVIVLTQYGTIATAIEATRLGATDYITKPFHVEELRTKLDRLVHSIEMDQENRLLREQLQSRPGFGGFIGMSPRMQRVYKLIQKVAQHNYPVLILGESGTGKELVARSIHFSGPRKSKTICSGGLLLAGAHADRIGAVRLCEGRVHRRAAFEAGSVRSRRRGHAVSRRNWRPAHRPAGQTAARPAGARDQACRVRTSGGIRARVIAATNRDLESAIRTGGFRQDLYFRLNVVQIKLPPLRERKADIPLLVNTFLEKFSDPARPIHSISEDAMRRIMAYDWPGNIRELENAIERAVALGSGPILHVGDLPSNLQYTSRKNIRTRTNSCRSKPWNAAPFSARCGKHRETSWPPRGCWASEKPRCTASSSNMNRGGRRREVRQRIIFDQELPRILSAVQISLRKPNRQAQIPELFPLLRYHPSRRESEFRPFSRLVVQSALKCTGWNATGDLGSP